MSHPFAKATPMAGRLSAYDIEAIISGSDGNEGFLDWAKWAVETGSEVMSIKQREDAAQAEADLIRAQQELLAQQVAYQSGQGPDPNAIDWAMWAPIGIGAAVLVGAGIYFATR